VPATTANDAAMWKFLDDTSPVTDNGDESVGQFEAYYYQAYQQLGFPSSSVPYLEPYLHYYDDDYLAALPTAPPTYDGGAAMTDIAQWVKTDGEGLAFIYGQWDPWTGGAFELGSARDSLIAVQPQGTHGSRIQRLVQADRQAIVDKLRAWTGVEPLVATARSRELRDHREPRIPPAMLRAVSSRHE
jgi:hypothetical protein